MNNTWTTRIAMAATFLAGCSGTVDTPGQDGPGAGADTDGTPSMDGTGMNPGDPNDPGGAGDPNDPNNPGGAGDPNDPNNPGVTVDPSDPNNPGDPNDPGTVTQPPVCSTGDNDVPATTQLPRLTRAQYANTVRDLFDMNTDAASMLAPDSPLSASVDQRAWDNYQAAAKALAAEVMANADAQAFIIPCAVASGDDACAQEFIADFGLRALRRPLTQEETARYQALYTNRAQYTANGTFAEAAQLIIEAFLMSPSFLTRAEISETELAGEYVALDGYEVASRLSYTLWGSMPDDALFEAAAAGALSSPDQILVQAQRMLLDGKARTQVAAFHEQYAHMGPGTRWSEITRDTAVFPTFSDALVPLLSEETARLFEHVTFEQGGTFQDLITTPVAFVNASTAPLYGLDAAAFGADLEPVDLDPTLRPGIFTRLGFLTSHSSFSRTSPILRGAYIQEEILCRDIPAPPPDVEGTPLPTDPNLVTNRQRVDAQTRDTACSACHHTIINPTGFAFESFNAVGAVQTVDNGAAIDTAASVPIGSSVVNVANAAELMTAVANSTEAQRCYAQKWVRYAYGRELTPADACLADNLASNVAAGGYTVLNLVADLTQSEAFRYRAIATEVAQ